MNKIRNFLLATAVIMMISTSVAGAETAVSLYFGSADNIVFDGVVSDGEYPYQLALNDIGGNALATIYFFHDGTNMYVGMISATNGWIGFGMNDKASMIGADFVLTEVGDETTIYDAYADAQTAPIADTDSRVVSSNASVVDGKTNTEFKFPLASSDSEDLSISIGDTIYFFVAGGAADETAVDYHQTHRTDPIQLKIEADDVTAPATVLSLSTVEDSSFLPAFIASVAVLAVIPILKRRR